MDVRTSYVSPSFVRFYHAVGDSRELTANQQIIIYSFHGSRMILWPYRKEEAIVGLPRVFQHVPGTVSALRSVATSRLYVGLAMHTRTSHTSS